VRGNFFGYPGRSVPVQPRPRGGNGWKAPGNGGAARVGMKWRRPPTHKLVAAREVHRLTGFSAREVLLQRDTQRLVRIDESGAREEFVRVPVALLVDEGAPEPDGLHG
jgi:hypothetical protein